MLAFYNVVHFAGSATGQQTLRFADPKDFQLFSASAMFMMLSLVPMAMTRAEPPPLPPKGRLEIASMIRMAPVAAVGIAMVGWANGTFWSLVPAFVERLDFGVGTVASFMTAVILGSAAGPYPLGRLSDRGDRRVVIAATAAAAAAIEAALVVTGAPTAAMLYAFGFALGLTNPVLYPLLTAHAVDRMGSEKAVAISATLLFLYCLGAISGPMIASSLMVRWGDPMLFVHNAAVHALMAAFVIWRIVVRAPAVQVAPPDEADKRPPAVLG
jgi:MFS family permease